MHVSNWIQTFLYNVGKVRWTCPVPGHAKT